MEIVIFKDKSILSIIHGAGWLTKKRQTGRFELPKHLTGDLPSQ
jgi:hypothetical protein